MPERNNPEQPELQTPIERVRQLVDELNRHYQRLNPSFGSKQKGIATNIGRGRVRNQWLQTFEMLKEYLAGLKLRSVHGNVLAGLRRVTVSINIPRDETGRFIAKHEDLGI